MELATMFADQKWNILKCLSEEKLSPLQLSSKLDTSMANISQQLRLLEAASLVKKEKIKNRDKGKPRTLFSLTKDYAYLISTMDNFTDKKLIRVTDHQKIILRIWFSENQELQQHLEKIYWKIKPFLGNVHSISLNKLSKELVIVSDKPQELDKISDKNQPISVKVVSTEKYSKKILPENIFIIYEKNRALAKGGT